MKKQEIKLIERGLEKLNQFSLQNSVLSGQPGEFVDKQIYKLVLHHWTLCPRYMSVIWDISVLNPKNKRQ